jgi:hypothetical protein
MPPDPPKTRRSGCLLALYVLLGLGALVLVTVGIGAWLFVRSERGQQLIGVAGEGISLMQQARRAPGTEALRAAGCAQAMVMPVARMAELIGQVAPQARKEMPEMFADGTVVFCQLPPGEGTGPECAEIARVYSNAVPDAPDRFGVIVQDQRRREPRCQGSYGRTDAPLEPLERER